MKKYLIYIAILSAIEIALAYYLTEWRHGFWTTIENKDVSGFYSQIGVFTFVALLFCFVSSYAQYFQNICAIVWRTILNKRVSNETKDVENFNQRVQDDCREYPDLLLQVGIGGIKALFYIVIFGVILALYSPYYVLIIAIYAIAGTLISGMVAKPLIHLNYESQKLEATYRNNLILCNLHKCLDISRLLAYNVKKLAYFQVGYGQISVILPIFIVAPSYFSGELTLGGMMQCVAVMATLADNLNWGVSSFNIFNRLLSCKKRLREIGVV